MKLRDYQEAAIDSIFDYFANGGTGNPIVALPTGSGKSVCIGEFIKRAYLKYPQTRILKLTHVKELIEQNLDKLLKLWPTAPTGVYSAGLNRKEACYPITFGGIGSVAKAIDRFGHIDLVVIDECHLVSPNDKTMYMKSINKLREINPNLKVIGFTATQYRLGSGMLIEDGGLFTDICFDGTSFESFNWFIDEGYLCPLVPRKTSIELDVSDVRIQGGEYRQNELQAAVDKEEVTKAALEELILQGSDRHHWLIFATGIEHAEHINFMLNDMGIKSIYVHSKMSNGQRDANIDGFKNGKFKAIVNNGVLTTGFDFPGIDLIGMLRPTQSPGLFVQCMGRGTRPIYASGFDLETKEGRLSAIAASQKRDCLVLDFAGNTQRLGPINDPILPRKKGKGGNGQAPVKICESCGTYNHASVRFCSYCKAEFTFQVKIQSQASTAELIKKQKNVSPVVETFVVDRITYEAYKKQDRPAAILVSYFCGLRMFKEWVCLEHEGFASKKARDWWRERINIDNIPKNTHDALLRIDELMIPVSIQVWINKTYPEILSYNFKEKL